MSTKSSQPILVTKPYLPPLKEYVAYLEGIWERNYLTNQGPLVTELEQRLGALLGAPGLHYVCNGGVGLQIILKALDVKGEVITTPFSYVATTSCVIWEGAKPVFADIEPDTLTISPAAVEAAITPRTEAILATHVYGNPCAVDELAKIATKHGLKLIYDAAHAFGVRFAGKSILEYGDASMISLHATKVFHTVEGGLIYSRHPEWSERMEWMRRFGHNGEGRYRGPGINGKGTEVHAAMGLSLLPYWEEIQNSRRKAVELYDELLLSRVEEIRRPKIRPGTDWNYSYYTIIFPSEHKLLSVVASLNRSRIFPRRYFWPSLAEISELCPKQDILVASTMAKRVLALPLHGKITTAEIATVVSAFSDRLVS